MDETGPKNGALLPTETGGDLLRTQDRKLERKSILDVGCGRRKAPGAIGLDRIILPGVDLVADIESGLPFQDNSFDVLYAYHVLEHVSNLTQLLAEFERVCARDAVIKIVVPHFTCVGAFGDPTHVRFFPYNTFDCFTDDPERYTWFTALRFRIRHRWIGFGRLHRLLGVEWWANRLPHIYETFFAFILPARILSVELIVRKGD